MNKRIKKKLNKRNNVFHYTNFNKYIVSHFDFANGYDSTYKIPIAQLFNNYECNRNGVRYSPQSVEKALRDFCKEHKFNVNIPIRCDTTEIFESSSSIQIDIADDNL
jgi:hypothetical protein